MEKTPLSDAPKMELPTIVFATHNLNKVEELRQMLEGYYRVQSLTDIGCHEPIVEDADTLAGNARIKARYVKDHYGLDCFADDTGLEVDALGGQPGVKTARYAGEYADSAANMNKLLKALQEVQADQRTARFRTSICLIQGEMEVLIEGVCEGKIAREQSGTAGFGYDPVFLPEGSSCTFAEMKPQDKHVLSHRGRAVRKMVDDLLASFD